MPTKRKSGAKINGKSKIDIELIVQRHGNPIRKAVGIVYVHLHKY